MADELDITKIPVEDAESARLLQILGGLLRKLTETLESRLLPFASVLASLAGHLETPTIQTPPGIEAEAEQPIAPQKIERTPLDVTPILRAISQKIEVPQIGSPAPVPRLIAEQEAPEHRTHAMPPSQELILRPMTKLEEMFRVFTSRLEGLQPKLPPIQLGAPIPAGEQERGTGMVPIEPAPSQQQQMGPALAFIFGGLMEGLKNRIQPYVQNINVGGGGTGSPPFLAGPGKEDGNCCERLAKLLHDIAIKLDTIIFVTKSIASALPGFSEGGEKPGAQPEKKQPRFSMDMLGGLGGSMDAMVRTNRIEKIGSAALGGVASLAEKLPGPVGLAVGGITRFGQGLFDSVGKLRDWGQALHHGNMQFADVSASMMAVQKEHEARMVMMGNRQGEMLATSARHLSEANDRFAAAVMPMETFLQFAKNEAMSFVMNLSSKGPALFDLLFGDKAKGIAGLISDPLKNIGPANSAWDFARDVASIDWDDPWGEGPVAPGPG